MRKYSFVSKKKKTWEKLHLSPKKKYLIFFKKNHGKIFICFKQKKKTWEKLHLFPKKLKEKKTWEELHLFPKKFEKKKDMENSFVSEKNEKIFIRL
jgi:hypothetical protein